MELSERKAAPTSGNLCPVKVVDYEKQVCAAPFGRNFSQTNSFQYEISLITLSLIVYDKKNEKRRKQIAFMLYTPILQRCFSARWGHNYIGSAGKQQVYAFIKPTY